MTAHRPALGRPVTMTVNVQTTSTRSARDPSTLATAIHLLLCVEARQAIQQGEVGPQLVDWILSDAHRCPDPRLLFDTLGF